MASLAQLEVTTRASLNSLMRIFAINFVNFAVNDSWHARSSGRIYDMEVGNSEGQQTHRREIISKKYLSDLYVALLSCFHSLMHLKVGLVSLVKKIVRCCIYIDVTTMPYDMALKMFVKYAFGAFFRLYITRCR